MTEPRLVSATADATLEAYDARFAEVRDRLVRICAGFVGDDAEDVIHDAYVRGRARRLQLRDEDRD